MNRAVGIRNRVADNTGRTLLDINHSDIFLDLSPKSKEAKAKKKTNGTQLNLKVFA